MCMYWLLEMQTRIRGYSKYRCEQVDDGDVWM
jgi:hypothetical protein